VRWLSSRLGQRVQSALVRRGRTPGLRTAKTVLAVVASFLVAEWLHLSEHPVVAPLTALLVVQLTLYQSLAHGLGRVGGVLAGVVVAVGLANLVGYTWWSLGAVVAASLVVGRLLRLGPHLFEVPISAMLVLEVGGGGQLAGARVLEAMVGAAVGIVVSALIGPPLYLQPAGAAIAELGERMAGFAREFADGLRGPWSRMAADRWLTRARGLGPEVSHADRTVARAEESARFNMRGKQTRVAQPRLRSTLTGLERCHLTLRTVARAVLDRTYFMPIGEQDAAYTVEQRATLADVLTAAASAMDSVVPIAEVDSAAVARGKVDAHLADLYEHRDRLSALLAVDLQVDQDAWKQHGALLASIDRLAVEVQAAAREPDTEWRPDSIAARPREVVRRIVDAATARRAEPDHTGSPSEGDDSTRPP
jgi:Aromatic acid exporter family member 1